MRFELIDSVIERAPGRLRAVKAVSRAEEYLGDHFPSFPVLPGVFMLEALVQAGRALLAGEAADGRGAAAARRLVLGEVRALKYGTFVAPGDTMLIEVTVSKRDAETGAVWFRGEARVRRPGAEAGGGGGGAGDPVCVSGRFVLRGVSVAGAGPASE
jgi:3-hydroxyacyl-[acyl-carrier-protein] dehydratase